MSSNIKMKTSKKKTKKEVVELPIPIPEEQDFNLKSLEEKKELESNFEPVITLDKESEIIIESENTEDLEAEFNKLLNGEESEEKPDKNKVVKSFARYKLPEEYKKEPVKHTEEYLGPYGTQWRHDKQKDDVLDKIHIKRTKQLEKLMSIEYPEQRSEGWFKMRNDKITASDGGNVIGANKNESQYKFLLKKTVGAPFLSNEFCYHGKKYEQIATMVYENRMNVKVEEFGLCGHPKYDFLGASPDGIVSKYKLDGEHLTNQVGKMLEIKCPLKREIQKTGEIKDNICPIYYWIQVQLQLECCDLDECDFWQCQILEYRDRQEFINDTDPKEPFRSKSSGHEKGAVIQLIPLDKCNDVKNGKYFDVIWDSAIWIYPPDIEMTPYEVDQWIVETVQNIGKNKEYRDYVLDKVLYWKLETSHNVTIERDVKWFEDNLPDLDKAWKQVEYFRKNKDKTDLLVSFIDSLTMKSNTKIMKFVEELMKTDLTDEYKQKMNDIIKKNNISKEESMKKKLEKKLSDKKNYTNFMFYEDVLIEVKDNE